MESTTNHVNEYYILQLGDEWAKIEGAFVAHHSKGEIE